MMLMNFSVSKTIKSRNAVYLNNALISLDFSLSRSVWLNMGVSALLMLTVTARADSLDVVGKTAYPQTSSAVSIHCASPVAPEFQRSCRVSPGLWRSERPTTLTASKLIEQGAASVVNLELLHSDLEAFHLARPRLSQPKPLHYFRVPDWEPLVIMAPTKVDDHVAHFIAVTRIAPQPILVHCRSGQNRTGVMVAAWRLFQGQDMNTVLTDMKSYGGFWSDQDSRYLQTLTPQRRAALETRIRYWMKHSRPEAVLTCGTTGCQSVQ